MAEMEKGIAVYQVITANRLVDGAVVFLTRNGKELAWSAKILDAAVFRASVIDRMLRLVGQFVADNVIVGPYAIEVTHNRKPLSRRELIRANGPTTDPGPAGGSPAEPDFMI